MSGEGESPPLLSAMEARILGCLAEKKETTPDTYPLTLNALVSAANQKTARDPVMALDQSQVHHALAELKRKGLVRQEFGSRVERYEHLLAQRYSLTRGQIALLGLLILRGPQTGFELLSRSERMAEYSGIDALKTDLDLMIGRRPPLVQHIARGPGQREDRYGHMLCGEITHFEARTTGASIANSGLEDRIAALEQQVAALAARLDAIEGR